MVGLFQVPYPFGTPLVRTEEELAASVFDLWRRGALVGPTRRGGGHQQKAEEKGETEEQEEQEEQHLDRFVVKLDDSASGGGNALLDMRSVLRRCDLLEARNQRARAAADRPALAAWLLSHRGTLPPLPIRRRPSLAAGTPPPPRGGAGETHESLPPVCRARARVS